mgnify:CR=1 FL=1
MQMPWILQSAVERELEGCPAQAVRAAALERVRSAFVEGGLSVRGSVESPITGHKGNVEYLLCGNLGA